MASRFPELDDDKGTSLVLVNTGKGKLLLDTLSAQIESQASDFEHAIIVNPAIVSSTTPHRNRANFFNRILLCKDFDNLVVSLLKLPLKSRISFFVGQCLRKAGLRK